MPIYEASALSTITTATDLTPLFGFRAGAQLASIREIHLFNRTAPTVVGALGLFRSTADGTGTVTSSAAQPRPVAGSALAASTAFVWTNYATARPTIGAVTTAMKRWTHGTALGNGMIWTFDAMDPLQVGIVAATSHIVIATVGGANAPATYDFTFVWEE